MKGTPLANLRAAAVKSSLVPPSLAISSGHRVTELIAAIIPFFQIRVWGESQHQPNTNHANQNANQLLYEGHGPQFLWLDVVRRTTSRNCHSNTIS